MFNAFLNVNDSLALQVLNFNRIVCLQTVAIFTGKTCNVLRNHPPRVM